MNRSTGQPGASALREYLRRRARREADARRRLGVLGAALTRISSEPNSTTAWKRGAEGEMRTARRLERHLSGTPVMLLHDRRMPGRVRENVDHIAVGPGGVTVIDAKNYRGRVRVERVGGLFSERRSVLTVAGRDRTGLVDALERTMAAIQNLLRVAGEGDVDARGALCFVDAAGLPLLGGQQVRGVLIDGPKAAARLAARDGQLDTEAVIRIWQQLERVLPPA